MKRPIWFRALVGVWGLWFTAALLEAPGIHACAVHSHAAGHDHAHAASAMRMPMAPQAAHGDGLATHNSKAPSDEHATCTCLGLCCCVSPAVIRAPSIDLADTEAITITTTPVVVDIVAPAISRTYARPYANGPPATVRVA